MSRYVRSLLNGGFVCLLLAFAAGLPLCRGLFPGRSLPDRLGPSEKLKIAEENVAIAEIGTDRARSLSASPRHRHRRRHTILAKEVFRFGERHPAGDHLLLGWAQSTRPLSLSGRELTALGISKQNVTKSPISISRRSAKTIILRFVSAAYYNVLLARKDLEIADANLERLTKYREAAEKRLRIGEVTENRPPARRGGALRGEVGPASGAERSRTGDGRPGAQCRDQGCLSAPRGSAVEGDVPPLTSFRDEAFATRADLKSLEAQKQIAADQIQICRGGLLAHRFRSPASMPGLISIRPRETWSGTAITRAST